MDELDYQDKIAIAAMAANANGFMGRQAGLVTGRSNNLAFNRTDFREQMNGPQYQPSRSLPPPPQYHNQFNHNQWQNNVPQNVPGWNQPFDEPQIPDGNLPPQPLKQYIVPGQPQQGQHPQQQYNPNYPPQQGYPLMEQTDSFNVPDYNQRNHDYLEDEQEFRDALIKEVKAQKKALNKLIRTNESLILTVDTLKKLVDELATKLNITLTKEPEPPVTNEVNDKSKDIPE